MLCKDTFFYPFRKKMFAMSRKVRIFANDFEAAKGSEYSAKGV